MTVVRRIISLLLQQPTLAKSIPEDFPLDEINLRGMDLFNQLASVCRTENAVTTALLLERHRHESHFSALEKLASHDHLLDSDQTEASFINLLNQLQRQASEIQLEDLLEKAKHAVLTTQEKEQLKQLLSSSKQ